MPVEYTQTLLLYAQAILEGKKKLKGNEEEDVSAIAAIN